MGIHNELGKYGEELASNYLEEKGYTVLETNFRFDRSEVDILAVVEVKTRSSNDHGDPQEFVKPKQISNLVKVVDHFIQSRDLELEVRFDIIAIIKKDNTYVIEHLKDAFYHF